MECQFKNTRRAKNQRKGINCPFNTMLRSVKTFDPSDPVYFTPGNWEFLPVSENYYDNYNNIKLNNRHICEGRRVGIKKRTVRPTVRAVGKAPDTVDSD